MVILSHSTGNANVRGVAEALAKADLLYKFFTSLASFQDTMLDKLGGFEPLSEIRRRRFDISLKPFIKIFPWWQLGFTLASKTKIKSLINGDRGIFGAYQMGRNFDKYVASQLSPAAKQGVRAIYCYEDQAINSFKKAEQLELKRIYDLPIAYWEFGKKLMLEEAERLPEWLITMNEGINDRSEKFELKTREAQMADLIVVPSNFVKDSLPTDLKNKVIVSPFGSPATKEDFLSETLPPNLSRPLRVLFVGSMGQRKGLGDLFDAFKLLKGQNAELVVMGNPLVSLDFYRKIFPDFTYEAGRPHEAVLKLMRTCDVLCLPSIVEGRALVMQEAMSQGLPLIITPNTGGTDLIVQGETGFTVPIRSPEKIAEKINWFIENRTLIQYMGKQARLRAAQYTWESYGDKIVQSIIRTMNLF